MDIDVLLLSSRADTTLRRAGISTVGKLTSCEPSDLLALKNFGQTCLAEVQTALARMDLSLAPKSAKAPSPRALDIAARKAAGEPGVAIAADLGISPQAVSAYLKRAS
jgi:DNA-binding NarL/FixJ family response regulator